MTAPGARALSIALVALLAASCLVTVAGAADATSLPRTIPMTAVFDGLAVGESAGKTWDVTIPKPAQITTTVVERAGVDIARWTVTLCPTSGARCVDVLTAPRGAPLAQGTYRLGIGVTILAAGATTSSIEGHLTFVERPSGSLALTGSDSLVPTVLSAVAALALGLFLLLAARRRREAYDPEDAS